MNRAILSLIFLTSSFGCQDSVAPPRLPTTVAPVVQKVKSAIVPLPQTVDVDPVRVALGNRLFHDPILSRDHTVSCASCHVIAGGGDDGRPRSIGIGGAEGGINAPTVLNAGFNFVQFWDGRAKDLKEQARGPVAHPKEMGADWNVVVAQIRQHPEYAKQFHAAYPDGVTEDNIVDAIAEFEKTLITPNGAFDRYLMGDAGAISAEAKRGYAHFQSLGCISCHQGQNVGGNMFQYFGVMGDYFAERGSPTEADLGRFNVTKDPSDKHLFRVPSLRNVEHTAPYFHDGSAQTLEVAIETMVRFQLGRAIDAKTRDEIKAFLITLSGPIPNPGALHAL